MSDCEAGLPQGGGDNLVPGVVSCDSIAPLLMAQTKEVPPPVTGEKVLSFVSKTKDGVSSSQATLKFLTPPLLLLLLLQGH